MDNQEVRYLISRLESDLAFAAKQMHQLQGHSGMDIDECTDVYCEGFVQTLNRSRTFLSGDSHD